MEVPDDSDCTSYYRIPQRAASRRKDGKPQHLRRLCLRLPTPVRICEQETESCPIRSAPGTTRCSPHSRFPGVPRKRAGLLPEQPECTPDRNQVLLCIRPVSGSILPRTGALRFSHPDQKSSVQTCQLSLN